MNDIVRFSDLSDLNKSSMVLELYEHLEDVAECIYHIRNDCVFGHVSLESIAIEGGDEVVATFSRYDPASEYTMSGPDKTDVERFPLSYLHDPTCYEKERRAVQNEKIRKLREFHERQEKKKQAEEEAERKLLQELKEKYEGS